MRIMPIHQYKSIPGFTTEGLSDFPILIRCDGRGKPQLLLGLGEGQEECSGFGMDEVGQWEMVAFTRSSARMADSQSGHVTAARHDLRNSRRLEYLTGRGL